MVLVAKYADHLPLYRPEAIFSRAGLAIPHSTLAQLVGCCGVQLQPSPTGLVSGVNSGISNAQLLSSSPHIMLAVACGRCPLGYPQVRAQSLWVTNGKIPARLSGTCCKAVISVRSPLT